MKMIFALVFFISLNALAGEPAFFKGRNRCFHQRHGTFRPVGHFRDFFDIRLQKSVSFKASSIFCSSPSCFLIWSSSSLILPSMIFFLTSGVLSFNIPLLSYLSGLALQSFNFCRCSFSRSSYDFFDFRISLTGFPLKGFVLGMDGGFLIGGVFFGAFDRIPQPRECSRHSYRLLL